MTLARNYQDSWPDAALHIDITKLSHNFSHNSCTNHTNTQIRLFIFPRIPLQCKILTTACLWSFRARFCLPFRAGYIRSPCSQLHNLIHGFESLVVLPALSTGQQLPHSWSMPRCRRCVVVVGLGGVSCVKWLLGVWALHFCWWYFQNVSWFY